MLVIFVIALALVKVAFAATACPNGGTLTNGPFCIVASGNASGNRTTFTIFSSASGWAALGAGSGTMSHGDAVVGFMNSTGVTTRALSLFQYGYQINANPSWKEIPLLRTPPSWAKIAFSVTRLNNIGTFQGNSISNDPAKTNYIYAYSDVAPTNPDQLSPHFRQHDFMSSFAADISAPLSAVPTVGSGGVGSNNTPTISTNSSGIDTGNNTAGGDDGLVSVDDTSDQPILPYGVLNTGENSSIIHGALMFIAWGVAPYVGIFIARYLKDALGVWWFRLHVLCMGVVTGGLTVVAFLIKFLTITPPHFDSQHAKIGFAIVIALIVQIAMGVISDRLWTPNRAAVPWWDKAHWWLGRSTFLLATANLFIGIFTFNDVSDDQIINAVPILLAVWIILCAAAFIYGEIRLGQVHHVRALPLPSKEMLEADRSAESMSPSSQRNLL